MAKKRMTFMAGSHPTGVPTPPYEANYQPTLEDLQQEERHREIHQKAWESKATAFTLLHEALHPDEYEPIDLDRVLRLTEIVQKLTQSYP